MIIGNVIGGVVKSPNTITIRDENGVTFNAVLTEELINLTATADDIRKDTVAITNEGLVVGTKVIPAYHSVQGFIGIMGGKPYTLPNIDSTIDNYDYTKLQAIICAFNSDLSDSVLSEYVCIDNVVYPVMSTVKTSDITKNHDDKTIEFGIVNETDTMKIIRYFMYKEIE